MAKTFGVVDILISRKSPEHRLPQHTDKRVPAVLSRACVGEPLAGRVRKTERVIKFTVGEQTGVRGNDRTAKLEHQPAVKVELERLAARFTRWVRHESSLQISLRCGL